MKDHKMKKKIQGWDNALKEEFTGFDWNMAHRLEVMQLNDKPKRDWMGNVIILFCFVFFLIAAHTIGTMFIMYTDSNHKRMVRDLNDAIHSSYVSGYEDAKNDRPMR